MRILVGALFACACAAVASDIAKAADCTAGTDALGVSRVIEVDPTGGPTFGTYQYPSSLELAPKEVVLTFDDGPHPKTTQRILDALDAECVKATFFPVGVWAQRVPDILSEVAKRGHTVGAHTWSHPPNLARLTLAAAATQIEKGFQAAAEAVGEPVAPFFRFPGLNDSAALTAYAAERGYAVFSCDIATDDWRGISARSIVARTLARLERQGGGIVLFHDTRATTAAAVPVLLRELKRRGYKIAHVVPKSLPRPEEEATMVAVIQQDRQQPGGDARAAAPADRGPADQP